MLTPSAGVNAKRQGKPYKLADERGMFLLAMPTGHTQGNPAIARHMCNLIARAVLVAAVAGLGVFGADAVLAQSASSATAENAASASDAIEIEYWQSIKDSKDPADFETYLKKFPNGHFTDLAWKRLDALRASSKPSARGGAVATASMSSSYAGKRLAIRMIDKCPSDPSDLDPLHVSPVDYYGCSGPWADKVRDAVEASLSSEGVFGIIGNGSPDFVLTVTLTQFVADGGAAGVVMAFPPVTVKLAANYELADVTGHVTASGTVHDEEGPGDEDEEDDATLRQFASKIAAAIVARPGAGASGIAGVAPQGSAPTATGTPSAGQVARPVPTPPQPDNKKTCAGSLFSCTTGHRR